jgi:DNA polymerase elongation subunit (family B)
MTIVNIISKVKSFMPEVSDTFTKYSQCLKENTVPIEKLVFTKHTSKNSNEYNSQTQLRAMLYNSLVVKINLLSLDRF